MLPREQHAWAATQLAQARTRDDVRAVFAILAPAPVPAQTQVTTASASASAAPEPEAIPPTAPALVLPSVPPTQAVVPVSAAQRKQDADEKDDDAGHTGLMVAFFIPADAAKILALPGYEKPGDLHITLAYLGDKAVYTPAQVRALRRALAGWASEQMPLSGHVSGVDSFPPSPSSGGKTAFHATVDVPHIQACRARLVKMLDAAGFPVDMTFPDYTPHITLAYVPEGKKLPVDGVPHVPLDLDTLWLAVGNDRYSFPMGDEQYPAEQQKRVSDADPLDRLAEALATRLERSNEAALRELRTRVLEAVG